MGDGELWQADGGSQSRRDCLLDKLTDSTHLVSVHIRSMEELRRVVETLAQPVEDDARARKRRRLVEVATALFMRHGYRKTSIDDVAAQAGIAKGTVYLYFKTKADLLVAAVRAEKLAYLERVRPLFDEGIDGRERLRRYLRMSIELSAEMPLTSRLLGGDRDILAALNEADTATMRASMDVGMDFLGDLIADATGVTLPPEALREKALALTGVVFSVVTADERARFGLPLPRFAAAFAEMLVDGLAPAPTVPGASSAKTRAGLTSGPLPPPPPSPASRRRASSPASANRRSRPASRTR
jgi:TetR/AcrR family transcriptional regulator, cholesterol catabolism regulator